MMMSCPEVVEESDTALKRDPNISSLLSRVPYHRKVLAGTKQRASSIEAPGNSRAG